MFGMAFAIANIGQAPPQKHLSFDKTKKMSHSHSQNRTIHVNVAAHISKYVNLRGSCTYCVNTLFHADSVVHSGTVVHDVFFQKKT